MSSLQRQSSLGSDNDQRYATITDEKKRKRMISNRESARRSRMKKQKQIEDLIAEESQLKAEIRNVTDKVNTTTQRYSRIEAENNVLRAQTMELTERLRSLNCVLQIAEEVSGLSMDIPEIPDTLMNPWQLPCPMMVHPIDASSADLFQY